MARDLAQEARDAVNQGLPKHGRGLDAGTRAALERALGDKDEGIKVGSFRDLQVGLTDTPVAERPVNPNQDDAGLIDINDHIAKEEATIGQDTGGTAGESVSYEEYTVEELKDELAARDLPTSGNKQDLIDRLNGK